MLEAIYNFDLSVFNAVFSLRNPVLDTIMEVITTLGDEGIIWIALTLVLLLFKKTRKIGASICVALVVMGLLNNEVLKPIIARARPFYAFDPSAIPLDHKYFDEVFAKATENVAKFPELAARWVSEYKFPEIVERPSSWSFPSGHTSSAFACATAVFACNKKAGSPLLVFAAIMGFTRIYVGVHYCTDVLVGMVVGIIYGIIGYYIAAFIVKTLKKKNLKPAKWFAD